MRKCLHALKFQSRAHTGCCIACGLDAVAATTSGGLRRFSQGCSKRVCGLFDYLINYMLTPSKSVAGQHREKSAKSQTVPCAIIRIIDVALAQERGRCCCCCILQNPLRARESASATSGSAGEPPPPPPSTGPHTAQRFRFILKSSEQPTAKIRPSEDCAHTRTHTYYCCTAVKCHCNNIKKYYTKRCTRVTDGL